MKITNYELFDGTKSFIIAPEENKKLVRKSDGLEVFNELYLGYTYYINYKLLDKPHFEVPEDYEEVDLTEEDIAILNSYSSNQAENE